jgi:hypothetical protein
MTLEKRTLTSASLTLRSISAASSALRSSYVRNKSAAELRCTGTVQYQKCVSTEAHLDTGVLFGVQNVSIELQFLLTRSLLRQIR